MHQEPPWLYVWVVPLAAYVLYSFTYKQYGAVQTAIMLAIGSLLGLGFSLACIYWRVIETASSIESAWWEIADNLNAVYFRMNWVVVGIAGGMLASHLSLRVFGPYFFPLANRTPDAQPPTPGNNSPTGN